MKKSNTKRAMSRKGILIASIAVVTLAIIGAAAYFVLFSGETYPVTLPDGSTKKVSMDTMKEALDRDTYYDGITINGIDVSGKTKEEVTAMFADDPSLDSPTVKLMLSVDGTDYPIDAEDLDLASNLNEIIDEAYNYARTSESTDEEDAIVERYEALLLAQKTPKAFITAYTADETTISTVVHEILDPLVTEAKDAKATSFDVEKLAFVISDSVDGASLDIDNAISDVKEALDAREYDQTIEVATTVTRATVTTEDLTTSLGLVSTMTTKTTDIDNRNSNINLICTTVDGLVLQPGEYFNYNDFIGQRTAEKGYKEAGGIYDGAIRQELGGGICQVAGTMYHAVLMADLQVDERHPHSWPSAYVDKGTDATVTWGGANFQFTNDTDYPIALHTYYEASPDGKGGYVTVEIYGKQLDKGVTIDVIGVVTSTTPSAGVEYIADPTLPVGTTKVVREPHDKIIAECYQIFYKDGVETSRVLVDTSTYRMIIQQVAVGVLAPDGSIYTIDPATGTVITPVVTPTPTPAETPTPMPQETPIPTPVPTA